MASRILDACEAVRAMLVTGIAPAEPDRVQRTYVPVVKRAGFEGVRAWVYPMAYRDQRRLSRATVQKEVRVAVEVEVKYDEPAQDEEVGNVPVEWVDRQLEWVETEVFDLLNDTGVHQSDLVGGRFRTESCEMAVAYDPGRLHEDKVLACLIEVVYTEPAGG